MSRVCADLVPKRLELPSEDTLHRCLAAALAAAAALLLFTREPTAVHPGAGEAGTEETMALPELLRPELDAAIADLSLWLTRRAGEPHTALDANLRLLSLGRAALAPNASSEASASLIFGNLQSLATPAGAAQPTNVPVTATGSASPSTTSTVGDADPRATLAILLEAGTPLTETLPLAAGPTPVGKLLEAALTGLEAPRQTPDPWALDLLSFAVLGGQLERREQLARLTHLDLTRLDRRQREELAPGNGEASAQALRESLAADAARLDAPRQRPRDLQLAASLFRAVAVLNEPALDEAALRQLNALLQRQLFERDAYRALLAGAAEAATRTRLHIDALENLGRLEQALYGAHMAFRNSERPTPRTAASMRRAARELVEHLAALRRASVLDPADGTPPPPELQRAVAHALRGLRASRIAHPSTT